MYQSYAGLRMVAAASSPFTSRFVCSFPLVIRRFVHPLTDGEPCRIYNTWMGEPTKLVLLEDVVEVAGRENSVQKAGQIGAKLLHGLKELEGRYPNLAINSRGTLCAFNMPNTAVRDSFLKKTLSKGLLIGGCGEATVRFRPALIFTESHLNAALGRTCIRTFSTSTDERQWERAIENVTTQLLAIKEIAEMRYDAIEKVTASQINASFSNLTLKVLTVNAAYALTILLTMLTFWWSMDKKMDNKFNRVETKMDRIEERMDSMETKMDHMAAKMDHMDERIEKLAKSHFFHGSHQARRE